MYTADAILPAVRALLPRIKLTKVTKAPGKYQRTVTGTTVTTNSRLTQRLVKRRKWSPPECLLAPTHGFRLSCMDDFAQKKRQPALVPASHIKGIASFSRTPRRVAIGLDAFARSDVDAFARYELSRGEAELLPGSSARSMIARCAILRCDGMGDGRYSTHARSGSTVGSSNRAPGCLGSAAASGCATLFMASASTR